MMNYRCAEYPFSRQYQDMQRTEDTDFKLPPITQQQQQHQHATATTKKRLFRCVKPYIHGQNCNMVVHHSYHYHNYMTLRRAYRIDPNNGHSCIIVRCYIIINTYVTEIMCVQLHASTPYPYLYYIFDIW